MTRRLNWEKLRLAGRRTLSVNQEREWRDQDRASRWLRAVERNQRERRPLQLRLPFERHTTARSTVAGSSGWSTVAESTGVPW
jgi:hypothetical protein